MALRTYFADSSGCRNGYATCSPSGGAIMRSAMVDSTSSSSTPQACSPGGRRRLSRVGLQECADLLEAAIAMFDQPYPRDRAARGAALLLLRRPGEKRAEWDPFDELIVGTIRQRTDQF